MNTRIVGTDAEETRLHVEGNPEYVMKEMGFICVPEAGMLALFETLGYNPKGGISTGDWARKAHKLNQLGLPQSQATDDPHNKRLLDLIKDGFVKTGTDFAWTKLRHKISFTNYPRTDTNRQLSLIEVAIIIKHRPNMFRKVGAIEHIKTPMPSHGHALNP